MATPSPPTIATTPILLNTPFIPEAPQLSGFTKRTRRLRCWIASCKTNYNNDNNANHFEHIQNTDTSQFLLDRRNILLGLGGLYGTTVTLGGDPANTLAAPIAPDTAVCSLTDAGWDGSVGDDCCPPKFDLSILKEFDFKEYPNPVMRVRRPAHKAMRDKKWLADYKRAISIMKSLPMSDPRSHMQQARIHCAYCDGAYPVLGHNEYRLQVHASWTFASFHRWYLYFYERILGKLINKPGFALPYWNWDHPDGMRIPQMFNDMYSPLYDPNRNENHLHRLMDLSYSPTTGDNNYPDDKQIYENLEIMRKGMVYPSATKDPRRFELFFGATYRSGDNIGSNRSGAGQLERVPHNNIHPWTGSRTVKGGQDMGAFWSSARDPIFYCHHSNVDRMWNIWTDVLKGGNFPYTPENYDYFNTYFLFYDENAYPVKVYIKDSFNIERLGYSYEKQDLLWLRPPKAVSQSKKSAPGRMLSSKKLMKGTVRLPKSLDSVIKIKVERPKKSRTQEEKEEKEEVLVIDFLLGMSQEFIKFDVYVNDEDDAKSDDKTNINSHYCGSFTSLIHGRGSMGKAMAGDNMAKKFALKLPLTQFLDEIGASDDDSIDVSIVPKSGYKAIVIIDVSIDPVES